MRTSPDLIEVAKGERGMLRGIEACIREECLVSALTLVFSSMDALAALDRPIGKADVTRKDFKAWVERYMLEGSDLACTADDLYGARCGVVHTYSPDSSTARSGRARVIVYEWRAGPPAGASVALPEGAIVLVIEDILAALQSAIDRYLAEVEHDNGTFERAKANSKNLLCYKPSAPISIVAA